MKLNAFLLSAVFCVFASANGQSSRALAQTAQEGGWKGVGYLSSISFPNLEPTRCSYRLVRAGSSYPDYGGISSYSLAYLNLSGYNVEHISTVGKVTSLKFDLPLTRLWEFALAIPDQYPEPRALFFLEEVRRMQNVSCEIAWSHRSKHVPSDSIQVGQLDPVIICTDWISVVGTQPSREDRMIRLELSPQRLALQKDSSCK